MIEVENLVKRYGSHLAVDHLTFRIEPGKIYGFLGPNGAGKSTTMNIMTGYIAPTEGSVKINGHDIVKEPEEAKKCIGYLPEIPPLYQDMTVLEYLTFAAELKKRIPKKEEKEQIKAVMEQTMITDMADRLIKNLSKGYKQRVGLAQAMLGYPDIIILDEPTVGLDPKQIIEIRDLIKELGKKHTVILSSHILSEVQAVCDEIMIISKGKLVASDTAEGLTALMSGKTGLEVQIKGGQSEIEAALQKISGISDYSFEESGEEGCMKLMIETDAKEEIREELFYVLAEAKLPLMSLIRVEKSLEDIFLELTEGEGKNELLQADGEKTNDELRVDGEHEPEEGQAVNDKEIKSEEAEGGNNDDSDL